MKSIDTSEFAGLEEALAEYEKSRPVGKQQDPGWGYDHVWMFLLEFAKDGNLGLCIWDTQKHEFIEEPATLMEYQTSADRLMGKYPGLFRF